MQFEKSLYITKQQKTKLLAPVGFEPAPQVKPRPPLGADWSISKQCRFAVRVKPRPFALIGQKQKQLLTDRLLARQKP